MSGGWITHADRVQQQYRAATGLLEKLMAAVRPEFRADELVLDPADPVFGGAICRVASCPRTAWGGRGLCAAHHDRWTHEGRPGLDAFVAATSPRWHKQTPLTCCRAPGCRRGVRRQGLCMRHSAAWERAGRPDTGAWLASVPATMPPAGQQDCLIGFCDLWAEHDIPFCQNHGATWYVNGRPEPGDFAARYLDDNPVPPHERIFLTSLPPQLKLEIQYALQRRHDERAGKAPPYIVMITVRFLAASGASSLLDLAEQQWRDAFGKKGNAIALLAWSRRQVADLSEGGGWDAEYPRDAWQMHRLGFEGRNVLDFSRIPQQQLKDLAKRWTRWRLSTGLGLEAGGVRPMRVLTRLAAFLHSRGIATVSGIDRAVLEAYLADLHAAFGGRSEHGTHVGTIGLFLTAVRQHGWAPDLPPDSMIFPGDQPPRTELLPRALAGHVMTQVEQPANLARQENPAYRLVTLILIRCGLRVSDALKLPFDCIVTDDSGAPYLRYRNHKMKREALVPLDDELTALIRGHQQQVLDRYPAGIVLFPRPEKNPDGRTPVSSATYRQALYRWLEHCDVRDEHGQPVHLTPHQWRHTLGSTLINRDVPQHVVQKILDHDSPQMTGHYARLSDRTVRDHWEKARKVNAEGQPVQVSPGGPLGDAAWAKQQLSRATQALPNGYCQLPLIRTCPHANSCLTCPMFVTTAEFLPQHHAQRRQTLQIITAAQTAGHARVAEMNQQVAVNLDKIITALEDNGENRRQAVAGAP
ncbi:MAG: tyrosine-type recombinase/integrase [Streptosporangiaceae bacterium]